MKTSIQRGFASLISSVFLYSPYTAWAGPVSCEPPMVGAIAESGRVYTFPFTGRCTLTGERGSDLQGVFRAYHQQYSSSPQLHSKQLNIQHLGMHGNFYELTQTVKEGSLTGRFGVYVLSNPTKVLVSGNSKSLEGDGNARHTQRIVYSYDVRPQIQGTYTLSIKYQVDIKRPALAPEDMFKEKAIEGITESVRQMLNTQSSKVLSALKNTVTS